MKSSWRGRSLYGSANPSLFFLTTLHELEIQARWQNSFGFFIFCFRKPARLGQSTLAGNWFVPLAAADEWASGREGSTTVAAQIGFFLFCFLSRAPLPLRYVKGLAEHAADLIVRNVNRLFFLYQYLLSIANQYIFLCVCV